MSDATHRLVRGHFETRPLGEMHLKGKTEPVTAWEVVAARESRTRLEVEAEIGLTPFVGARVSCANCLKVSSEHAAATGTLHFSSARHRKIPAAARTPSCVGDAAAWREGHCLSFGGATTFHPLVDLIRRWFGVEERDSETAIVAKLERRMTEIDGDLGPVVPYLRVLLSLDPGDDGVRAMMPAERRGETFETLRRLLLRAAERRPQSWSSRTCTGSIARAEQFLTTLQDSVLAIQALLIFTYRPGYANPFGESRRRAWIPAVALVVCVRRRGAAR